ncbi:MAG TPA: hypothetical protein VHS99_15815 [Chloroflexota bacterium]|nr:hypothetical protein [Chloroflexota bacterium]
MTATRSARVPVPVAPPALLRRWVHSREEDAGGVEVYRPQGFPFPPSFGRDGFELLADGTFILHDIGPADGVVEVRGRWELLPRRRVAVAFPGGERPGFAFGIVAVDETVLRIRRSTRQAGPGQPAADEGQLEELRALPPPASFRVIAYEKAEVLAQRTNPPRYVLQVSGIKAFAKMTVQLKPLVYVRQPEYWEIEVVGGLPGVAVPAKLPYTVTLPLGGTLGSRGIQVLGANRSDRFDVPPGQEPHDR